MQKRQKMKTDFESLAAMKDDDIDCSDIEAFTKEFLDAVDGFAEVPEKELVSIRIDKPVLKFYRQTGRGYQTRMNAVLRAYAEMAQKGQIRAFGEHTQE
jgi:uncharacterized protein (DUF4415 family)